MKRGRANGDRITKALAKLERLQQRNDAQREQLVDVGGRMADHASTVADQERPAALAGDVGAQQRYLRALRGRAHGHRLA